MTNMPVFQPQCSADQAHKSLQESIKIQDHAQHCALLWFGEIMRRKLYRELNYGSMRAYAMEGLGFSSTRAGDFIRLATRLEELPVVKEEVSTGQLGYTKVREIVSVADQTNEQDWVNMAKEKSRRELAIEVQQAKLLAAEQKKVDPNQGELMPRPTPTRPAAIPPVRIGFELTPLQNARYEAIVSKIGHRGNKADLLLDMAEALLAGQDIAPRGATPESHYQIHIHDCPTCAKAVIPAPLGDMEVAEAEVEAVRCDALVHRPGERNKATIPPRTRREVLARDRHRCRRKGCDHTRHLEIHHVRPRTENGSNETENLVTLCTACHTLWHERGGDRQGLLSEAPSQ